MPEEASEDVISVMEIEYNLPFHPDSHAPVLPAEGAIVTGAAHLVIGQRSPTPQAGPPQNLLRIHPTISD